MPPKKKKAAVEPDENIGLIAKLRSLAPTGKESGTWEVSSTKELVLSAVKYTLTSGIDSFDDVAGGMPIGRMSELYGLESCGKTAMSIRLAARPTPSMSNSAIASSRERISASPCPQPSRSK